MKTYCTQNAGNCLTCSLVNYGQDCRGQPLNIMEQALQDEKMIEEIKCGNCGHFFEYEERGITKRRCGGFDRAAIVPKEGKEKAPVWCPKR